jgi:hypothetical protein
MATQMKPGENLEKIEVQTASQTRSYRALSPGFFLFWGEKRLFQLSLSTLNFPDHPIHYS